MTGSYWMIQINLPSCRNIVLRKTFSVINIVRDVNEFQSQISRKPVILFAPPKSSTTSLELGKMKLILYLAVVSLTNFPIAFSQNILDWLNVSRQELLDYRNSFAENSKADLLFLIDTSGSLLDDEFAEEKRFVTNLLNEIRVAYESTRVEIIPFGTSSDRFIRQISESDPTKNKCTLNEKFEPMGRSWGVFTNTREAMRLAKEVTLGEFSGDKRGTLGTFQTTVFLITDGKWNYPFNSENSPVSFAEEIRSKGGEIFAIGVGNVDYDKLQQVVENPNKQAFHLADFDQFTQLATYLRGGEIVLT